MLETPLSAVERGGKIIALDSRQQRLITALIRVPLLRRVQFQYLVPAAGRLKQLILGSG